MGIGLLEKLSYISLTAAALIVSSAAVYDRTIAVRRPPAEARRLNLKGIDWASYRGTVVLSLSTSCHWCAASAPFYQELSALQAGHPELQLVAVFPQPLQEADAYLTAKGIGIRTVRSDPGGDTAANGTPTLFFVGPDGLVKQTLVGFLNDDRKHAALSKLDSMLRGHV